jgi:hypothetical protein
MSLTAVQKHVAVLERAGLVTKKRRGREQLVRTDADAVRRARQALDQLEATWRGRVADRGMPVSMIAVSLTNRDGGTRSSPLRPRMGDARPPSDQ